MKFLLFSFALVLNTTVIAQDSLINHTLESADSLVQVKPGLSESISNSDYKKPAHFSFLTNIPGNVVGFTKQSFRKDNLPALAMLAASTGALLIFDQQITNSIQSLSRQYNIESKEHFSPIIKLKVNGKQTNLGKMPKNINTAFYNLGQGSSVIFIAGGLFLKGKISKDNRALQTSNQLINSFIALGAGTQLLKYASGRENPSHASVSGGKWRPFPSWSDFQNDKARYDAFPSGHLATLMSAVTILGENYAEIKWIKPLGYTIAGLCGLAMINNGVHWASDFPLGIALGYGYGKYISKKNKPVKKNTFYD